MDLDLDTAATLIDTATEFAVTYGFQLLGALVFFLIGLKLAAWAGAKSTALAAGRNMDVTLAGFIGNVVKVLVLVMVIIITLGNFGISTAPLIALAGASAFGLTLAIQGPLSNYGAGLVIILTRPFVLGDTISVQKVSGVVRDISLSTTVLTGEDREEITIPNKEIVGQVIINSFGHRVVEARIAVTSDADLDAAVAVLSSTLGAFPDIAEDPAPQVGIHDFTYGGVILGIRYWVPSQSYFQTRYAANIAALAALKDAELQLMPAMLSLPAPELGVDDDPN